ncbi:MAG: ATP-binding protein [Pseudomonadota bacterium]
MIREFAVSTAGLTEALDTVQRFCRENEVDDSVTTRLCVIVDETVGNMMMHGELNEAHSFMLEIDLMNDGARILISDPGEEFDPVHWPPEGHTGPGGRGIALTKGLASDLSYERQEGRNVLTVGVYPTD